MHPVIRGNALAPNLLPTLLLAVVLSKVSTVIIQRITDRHFLYPRSRHLPVAPSITCERRLTRQRRAPILLAHSAQPLTAMGWSAIY